MTEYTPINPSHYRKTPVGIELECIKYIRYLPHSQATAGKYIYRAGNKDLLSQDLGKTLWYLNDAIEFNLVSNLNDNRPELVETIDPFITLRSRMFYNLVTGNVHMLRTTCEFATENLDVLD